MNRFKLNKELFDKYVSGNCTPEEEAFVRDSFRDQPESEFAQWMETVWNDTNSGTSAAYDKERLFRVIQSRISSGSGKRFMMIGSRMAAAIALLIISTWIYQHRIFILDVVDPIAMVEKKTSAGERLKVQLPDGSIVWMNVLSTVIFPEKFRGEERKIQLLGEAFFEVVKDTDKPFIVITTGVATKVLGTSFNVKAYEKENIEVTVSTGKVSVALYDTVAASPIANTGFVLAPDQKIIFNTDNQNFSGVQKISSKLNAGWKEGKLVFKESSLGEVLSTLERWYGVQFEYENESVSQKRFTATFHEGTSLAKVLKMLTLTDKVSFEKINDFKFNVKIPTKPDNN